jgi:hypothetical protein
VGLGVSDNLDCFCESHNEGDLTGKTPSALKSTFAHFGHQPSQPMWEGIKALIETLEGMANGTLGLLAYLSSLDPGVGKTEAIVHFIRELCASPWHRHVGVLICVAQLSEIARLVQTMGLKTDEYAVYTSDEATNALGTKDIDNARVLFLTQQMIDSRLSDGKPFSDLDLFHFKGSPRQVKIWDEAMLPAEELTLTVDALFRLPSILRKLSSPLADEIYRVCKDVSSLSNRATYHFPDFVREHGLRYEDAKPAFSKEPTRDRQAVRTLWHLSGKLVRVSRDKRGNTLLGYRNHLPQDFFPVVILDESGRVRATYDSWEKDRRNLVRLTTAAKRYDGLSIHVWNRGGGKEVFRTQASDLIEGIAATINTKPDDSWLVVLHKEDEWHLPGQSRIPDLTKLLTDLLSQPANVRYLTWGNEKATNEYRDIKNVVLAGTLFFPKSLYEVRARASKKLAADEELDADSFKALELGEHKNLILQAACRGAVRRCIGDQCGTMDLYIIASNTTGIPLTLHDIFPGVKLERWLPLDKPLTGRVGIAVEYIRSYFEKRQIWVPPLSFKQVQEAIGMKYRQNFNQNIRKHPAFREALEKMRVQERSLNNTNRLTHFQLIGLSIAV